MINFGFIGFGKFSQVRKKSLEKFSSINLVGFYDPSVKDIHDIAKVKSLDELFDRVDALIISVPPKFAPEYVSEALSKGKKVFCEKPAAINCEELKKIEKHLKSDSVLAYGFNHRQHSSIKKIKETLDNKILGKILWMRGRYGKEVEGNYVEGWRCDPHLNGGGILIDQGIHLIDLMSNLSGGFDGVQAVLSNNYLNIDGIDDNGFITLYSSKTKISASIHSTITQWRYLFSLEIFCEKGSIILNGLRTNSGNYGDEILSIKPNTQFEDTIKSQEIQYNENLSWEREMQAFIKSVNENILYPYAKYEDAKKITNLIDLIYKEAIWL